MKLFSTEQVSKYHPDKYCDQISDAILDTYLAYDARARVAVETLAKDKTIVLAGEIQTSIIPAETHETIVKRVAAKLGYEVDNIIDLIGKQSSEINGAVDRGEELGAVDQGIVFGFATKETESKLPYGFDLANRIIKALERDVEDNPDTILKGDAKTQVTVDLDIAPGPKQVKTILISACHVSEVNGEPIKAHELRWHISNVLFKHGIELPEPVELIINPAGPWTVGGPTADAGLTGRKIVCDQYGGYAPVGGGAFSGKDPSKVDRSGSYAARALAEEILDTYPEVNWAKVQLGYAIGRELPVSIDVETDKPELTKQIQLNIKPEDYTPKAIIARLHLTDYVQVSYEQIAEGCHYYAG